MNNPTTGRSVLVHKQDAEGSLSIDPTTGFILTPLDERPEWASNLQIANTAERHMFYMERLGSLYTDDMKSPDVMAFEDILWTGTVEYPEDAPYINAETGVKESFEVITVEADHEFRQQVLAEKLDIRSELDKDGNETGNIHGALAEVAIAADNQRTQEELDALEQNKEAGFQSVTG
jgi:hypothetical protein